MEIFLYAFSVLYSPGPMNMVGLNSGLTGQFKKNMGFFGGVGLAMFSMFIIFGYTGQAIISSASLPYIALLGSIYTFYLSFKLMSSRVELEGLEKNTGRAQLTFKDGFLMQALNPKGMLVVLPITTVMFPAARVTGPLIVVLSLLISIGGAGAPGIYCFLGAMIGKKVTKESYFNIFNKCMGVMLVISAVFMFHDFLHGLNFI